MSAHTLDLSRLQRPVWDTERRYGEICNPNSPRFSLLLNRTVFTTRKDPLRPPPVLAVDCSQEASGASQRKRLSNQVCSRPLKPALLSPRKLVSPDLWPMPHAEPRATRLVSSPRCSTTYFQHTTPWSRPPVMGFGDRYSEYEKPAAYAPLLVQRALVLGACSQEAEGQAGKASSPDLVIRMTCTCNWLLVTLVPILMYKHLAFNQKLPAYDPLLVQRALVLGACSQDEEGWAGKASSPDSVIRMTNIMHAPPAVVSLLLSYGSQCRQRAALHKHLPFAQKLSADDPPLVQRAQELGACSQEEEGQAGKARSPDSTIRRVDVIHAQSDSCEVYRPSSPSSW